MKRFALMAMLALPAYGLPALAQEAVVSVENAEELFTSPDPQLHANKQVVYRLIRDLLEAGHWSRAGDYIAEDYIQHNPNAESGLAPVIHYFTEVLAVEPQPIPERLSLPIVAVTAEGDLVTVLYRRMVEDANHPNGSYTTTWFDTWRIVDGKAAQHWDPALLGEAPKLR